MLGGIALLAAVLLWAPGGLGIDKVFCSRLSSASSSGRRDRAAGRPCDRRVPSRSEPDRWPGRSAGQDVGRRLRVVWRSIAYLQGQICLVTFCFTIAGALLAFLCSTPLSGQVFMGDTGALALGATLAVVALMLGQVLLLPMVGLVFVAIIMSVMLQIGCFKATGGKRLFRMRKRVEIVCSQLTKTRVRAGLGSWDDCAPRTRRRDRCRRSRPEAVLCQRWR